MPLRIAAKLPRSEKGYFKERLELEIDGEQIKLDGEVNDKSKEEFLAGAAALLFPIDWPEPFGLVMIEAMACGTPVIAFRSGSVPEVIDHGMSGFIVEGEQEAIGAVRRLGELDRHQVRSVYDKRFTSARMPRTTWSVTTACSELGRGTQRAALKGNPSRQARYAFLRTHRTPRHAGADISASVLLLLAERYPTRPIPS